MKLLRDERFLFVAALVAALVWGLHVMGCHATKRGGGNSLGLVPEGQTGQSQAAAPDSLRAFYAHDCDPPTQAGPARPQNLAVAAAPESHRATASEGGPAPDNWEIPWGVDTLLTDLELVRPVRIDAALLPLHVVYARVVTGANFAAHYHPDGVIVGMGDGDRGVIVYYPSAPTQWTKQYRGGYIRYWPRWEP